MVTGISISHRSASVGDIEAAVQTDPPTAIKRLLAADGVTESFVLQTCNRAEWYVVTPHGETGRSVLESCLSTTTDDVATWLGHEEALTHLMRVAAGLESMVLGEDEILGQLRRAVADAQRVGATGEILEEVLWGAIHCGERVRTETAINEGTMSIGRAAVELAAEHVSLQNAAAAVVGAGEIGRAAGHAFADTAVETVVIANRTVPHAVALAEEVAVDADAVGLDALPAILKQADIVVTATGAPGPIVDASMLPDCGRPVFIDIAQPRDVDPNLRMDGNVFDLDDLTVVTEATIAGREAAAAEAERMIANEADRLLDRLKRAQADDVIATMYESAEAIKARELAEARTKLAAAGTVSDEEVAILEGLADALVGQLLAAPTKSLREAAGAEDWETIQTALALFDPEFPVVSPHKAKDEATSTAEERA